MQGQVGGLTEYLGVRCREERSLIDGLDLNLGKEGARVPPRLGEEEGEEDGEREGEDSGEDEACACSRPSESMSSMKEGRDVIGERNVLAERCAVGRLGGVRQPWGEVGRNKAGI